MQFFYLNLAHEWKAYKATHPYIIFIYNIKKMMNNIFHSHDIKDLN